MKTLVLADDDQMILDLYNMKFTKAGFKVVLVSDAASALSETKTQMPAAILLDRRLGADDGMQVLKSLRTDESTKNIPVLLLSNQDPTAEELSELAALGK